MTLLWCRFSFLFALFISKRFQKCRTHNIFRVGIAKMHKLTHMCNACWSRVDKNRIKCIFWEGTKKNENYWTKKSHDITLYKKKNSMNLNQHHPFWRWETLIFSNCRQIQWSVTHSTIHQHHVVHPRVTNKIG